MCFAFVCGGLPLGTVSDSSRLAGPECVWQQIASHWELSLWVAGTKRWIWWMLNWTLILKRKILSNHRAIAQKFCTTILRIPGFDLMNAEVLVGRTILCHEQLCRKSSWLPVLKCSMGLRICIFKWIEQELNFNHSRLHKMLKTF